MAALVLAGVLASTTVVEAIREPAIKWGSGDHDIYQASERGAVPVPSLTESPSCGFPRRIPDSTDRSLSRRRALAIYLWLGCLENLWVR